MTQDYFVFPPFEVYTGEQLTKEVKQSLIARGLKCVAVVFNCESYEDFERTLLAEISRAKIAARKMHNNRMTGYEDPRAERDFHRAIIEIVSIAYHD